MNSDILVVVPARLDSKRFPGKPLADVDGNPLLWHTWRVAATWPKARTVVVATPDEEIVRVMEGYGARVEHTSPDLRNGSQRAFVVWERYPGQHNILIDLQADEPCVTHAMLDRLVSPGENGIGISTLAAPFPDGLVLPDPNIVKVAVGQCDWCLYFSRAPLAGGMQHIGVYAFSREAVPGCQLATQSPLGQAENLEQLDWLDYGWGIQARVVDAAPISINTPADLERFREHLKHKP